MLLFKKWIYIGISIAILSLITYSVLVTKNLTKTKKDRDRISKNFVNAKFQLDSTITKSGQKDYVVKSLNLKIDEFETTELELNDTIKKMGFKIKTLQSIIEIKPKIEIKIKIVPKINKLNDTTFVTTFDDKWLTISQKIILLKQNTEINVTDLQIKMIPNILLLEKINYKRFWIFWKRPVDMSLHVINADKNPYFKIDQVKIFKFENK